MRLLAAVALTLTTLGSALVATAPARAADTGVLHVTVVDEHGDPMPGAIAMFTNGSQINQASAASEATVDVAPGSYGVLSLSPWGGVLCKGLATCDYLALATGSPSTDGKVQVQAGQTTDVVLKASTPVSLRGPAVVGKDLALKLSPGMQNLMDTFGGSGGITIAPSVTWLRDGTEIPGADDFDYVPTTQDAGHSLSATMAYVGLAATQFQYLTGELPGERQTSAVKVSKVPTKSYVILPRKTIDASQRGGVRVEVTEPGGTAVPGKVTISAGSWQKTLPLRNGSARVRLPAMKAGTYPVHATYGGSAAYAGSVAKAKTLTVR